MQCNNVCAESDFLQEVLVHVKSDCALTTLRVLPDFRQSDHTLINGLTKLGQLLCFLLS